MIKAIILTTQRTGSTFLVSCLDAHPDICCLGELLAGSRLFHVPELIYRSRYMTKAWRYLRSGAWHPIRLMRRYFDEARLGSMQLGMRPVMAFKAMYNQIRPPWTLRYLRERTDIRILHLRRDNLLKAFVSSELLTVKRDKRWQPHVTSPVEPVKKVISGAAAIAYLRRAAAEYETHEQIFRDHSRLALSYETMIDGQGLRADVAREICLFLGVREYPMRSDLVKVNPERLEQMVDNYDEFAAAIRGTEFAAMLD
ncbi:MAG: sulfotransferase [Steroidobacteraceae bacterium]